MQVIFLLNQIVSKVMLVALFKMYVSCFMCNLMRKQFTFEYYCVIAKSQLNASISPLNLCA